MESLLVLPPQQRCNKKTRMHKNPKVDSTIAIRTAKLESREVIRLEEEGLQTKIFNERRFSPARHGRKLFIKILFSKLLALPQKNVNIWDLQKTRLWLKGISSEDTYKLRRIKGFVIAAHRLTLVVHQELFKIPPGMCSQKHLFNG